MLFPKHLAYFISFIVTQMGLRPGSQVNVKPLQHAGIPLEQNGEHVPLEDELEELLEVVVPLLEDEEDMHMPEIIILSLFLKHFASVPFMHIGE